jgi:hypothetical protein
MSLIAAHNGEKTMQGNRKLIEIVSLMALMLTSLFFARPAKAQAQHPAYFGTFTLPYQIRWGGSILQPGKYSVTIKSTRSPMIALVRTVDGNAVTYVMNSSISTHTNGENALLLREKKGQFVVHSLALADLGVVLIFDPSLAQEPVRETRQERSLPILSAEKQRGRGQS